LKKNLEKDSNMSNLTESRLATLLKSSKAIMNKVEDNSFSRGNIDPSRLMSEGDGDDWVQTPPSNQPSRTQPMGNNQGYRNIGNTKMPKSIVDAMVNSRIDIPDSPFHSFEASEALIKEVNSGDNDYEEKPMPVSRLTESYKKTSQQKQNTSSDTGDLRQIVKEEISKILPKVITEYFDKRVISEQIQVKVGDTLFSGNLKPLPSKLNKK
jgi:hypothetical protein